MEENLIDIYHDNDVGIFFSQKPVITVRCPEDAKTLDEWKDIIDKPFMNMQDLKVLLIDYKKKKTYSFCITAGYTWDGASIPRICWRIIGAKTDNMFLRASMIHDVLCENKNIVDYDRYFADKVFERLLSVAGVGKFKRFLMFHSVDNFQKLQGWKK